MINLVNIDGMDTEVFVVDGTKNGANNSIYYGQIVEVKTNEVIFKTYDETITLIKKNIRSVKHIR